SNSTNGGWENFRLPMYVKPVHYELHLEPDLNTDLYRGTVSIHLEVSQPTSHLWLHIRETFVSALPRIVLQSHSGQKAMAVKGCFEYRPQEYVVVEAEEMLATTKPGEMYILSLDFQGWLNGSLVGFYRVTYQEGAVTKKIAATDHEPTDARKSFPCFDEPNKKATYNISITHDSAYGALSNMPVEGTPQQLPGDKVKTSFQKSVPMSTYLVCFAVHQFQYVERNSSRGIPLRIYAQPAQIKTATYAADTTKVIFDYFEEYFNMTYSIPKLDKIAIPDFGTGAMENWGLITYRETNLLYDENESSSYNKQRVASVIAHELVHQWFGNIVTMDWWDDLWLNEGFASFFEYVGVEHAEPTWKMRDIMLIGDVLPVMLDDALLSSHPIIVDVSTPAEITSVFDAISYSKGASLLRMLEDWMGRDKFRDGCRKYLKDYHYKNAKTANFWESLANVSGLQIANVMDTWTTQMGYPVLDLSISSNVAKVTQKRFLLNPNADPTQPPSPLRLLCLQLHVVFHQSMSSSCLPRSIMTFASVLQHCLFVKPEKLTFHSSRISFLGYIVSVEHLEMDPSKIQAHSKKFSRVCSFLSRSIDLVSGHPESDGNTMVLDIVDRFSKAARFTPMPELPSASETTQVVLQEVFWRSPFECKYGFPLLFFQKRKLTWAFRLQRPLCADVAVPGGALTLLSWLHNAATSSKPTGTAESPSLA
ncbi:glutamyl aminopeptidase, partial [Aplochiton taeniatus]